jgi:dihydropteroate synthase
MSDLFQTGEPVLIGIVNVTPDSFSDGGLYLNPDEAILHGKRLIAEGAHILDIGGESTRPGSDLLPVEEEIKRILPVVTGLKNCGAMISVDTRNAATMKAVLDAGASMINDVSALRHDPDSLRVVAESGCNVCLMHMKGDPRTMQENPAYEDVFQEVYGFLEKRVEACLDVGVPVEKILIDPGIGFGKTLDHNLILLSRLENFRSLKVPVMLGASRKRFIESLCPGASIDARMPGSVAACLAAWKQGVKVFRVHDIAETAQALTVFRNIIDKTNVFHNIKYE